LSKKCKSSTIDRAADSATPLALALEELREATSQLRVPSDLPPEQTHLISHSFTNPGARRLGEGAVSVAQRVKAASRRILLAAAKTRRPGCRKFGAVASEARHRSQAQENGASPEKVSEI
jgi:hypothetical protein